MTEYKNPWHCPTRPYYGPAMYTTDAKPTEYHGYLIYERIDGHVWDVVQDGVCITQRAGLTGAKRRIDELITEGGK